jgi:hypothetical protein
MLTMQRGAVLLCGAALIGCSGNADRELTAPEPILEAAAAGPHVTGHATVALPAFGGAEQKYSQSAIRHSDGSVSGEFQLKSEQEEPALRIHGNVICFTVVGNTARLGGVIEHSNTALAPPGTFVVWTVVDNGEGNKSPPDQTSDFFVVDPATAQFHCAVGFNLPLMPVVGGNLQVHE